MRQKYSHANDGGHAPHAPWIRPCPGLAYQWAAVDNENGNLNITAYLTELMRPNFILIFTKGLG